MTSLERPLVVRVAAEAAPTWLAPLQGVLGGDCVAIDDGTVTGPFIPVVVPASLSPGTLGTTRALCGRAAPGRGVLVGGARSKDTLLQAINELHVFRALPDATEPAVVAAAIRSAHAHMTAELTLGRESHILRTQTTRLDAAVVELRRARSRLLHAERLSTLGRIAGGLIESARQHQEAIDAFAGLVTAHETDAELLRLLTFATEGTRSISTLLDEIQAYAQDRQQTYDMHIEALDDLVNHATAFSRFDTQAKLRTMTVECSSGAMVLANRYRIYQVVLNLLRNAVQATEAGDEIHVRTGCEGDRAWLSVQDTGSGMPPEVRARIFDPFFSTKRDKGLGLGLRITLATVQHHGGTITCDSEPGRGTTFRITLPCASMS